MACLRIVETNMSLFPRGTELSWNFYDRGVTQKFGTYRKCRRRLSVCCEVGKGDNKTNGEEPPESLFMKELRRRGMTPTSLLEDRKRSQDEEFKVKEEEGGFSTRNSVSTEYDKALSNQRERSLLLNSEGLEGLVPRARLLLTLGGTFFLSFGPLILVSVSLFSALYLYFGPTFVHDASKMNVSPPEYIDPYKLLEDERIYSTAPRVK